MTGMGRDDDADYHGVSLYMHILVSMRLVGSI